MTYDFFSQVFVYKIRGKKVHTRFCSVLFYFMVYLVMCISNIYYMRRFFALVHTGVSQAYIKLFPNTLKKRTWWPIFVVGVILISAMAVGITHAQFGLESLLNGLVELIATILIELAKLCIFLTIFFLRAFITLASYNNFIDVSVVKLGWVMVRDVANLFFIVGLLVIAFATILGFESYEWKHGLVKIVLMAILINFSNLIAQLVIDVAHIFTITFLNAVSATAGGNLITLFQMDKILALAAGAPNTLGETREVASLTLFAGGALAFIFALLAALTVGAYLVVMIFRIVMLWALIVLSPFAFMLYAVPKGEDYAHEWWSEFSKHVIVAPIMVFFLWLAFATLGTGQIITEIQDDPNVIQLDSTGEEKQSVTVLEISTWENFASFLLGIGFLWVGIKKTEETGATGAGLVGGAIDFTKNVATIATGYAAGRWLVGAAGEKIKSDFPIIGAKSIERKAAVVKGAIGKYKSKVDMARDAKVQDWEKGLKGAWDKRDLAGIFKFGAKRFLLGSVIASSKKKDAVAETWEEMAHLADEEHEARISNSGTFGGAGKDEQRIRTELAVELKEAKGKQKGAEGLLKLKESDEQVNKDLDMIAETEILGHKAEERLHTEEEEHHLHTEDELRTKGESALVKDTKKYFDSEDAKRKKGGKPPLTEEERDAYIREKFKDLKGPAKYAALSRGLKEMQARNEKYKDALEDEEKMKKEQARLKQSKINPDYKAYDERATKATLQYESAKGVYEAQAKKGSVEMFQSLIKDREFQAEQQEQARLSGEVKALEDKKAAEKELLALEEIRKILAAGGFAESIAAQVALEASKGLTDARKEFVTGEERKQFGGPAVRGFDQMLAAQAVLENQKEEAERSKIHKLAEERAVFYAGQGDNARADAIRQQAAAQILKKDSELFANLSYNQRRGRMEVDVAKLDQLRDVVSAAAPGSQAQQVAAERLARAEERQRALVLSNIADGSQTAEATRAQAARALGFDKIDSSNSKELELRMLLGIARNKINQATGQVYTERELEDIFNSSLGGLNDPRRENYTRQYIAANKVAAGKGELGGVRLMYDFVGPNGRIDNRWLDQTQRGDDSLGLVDYFAADMSPEAGVKGLAEVKKINPNTGSSSVAKFGQIGRKAMRKITKGQTGRFFENKRSFRISQEMNEIEVDNNESFDDFLQVIENLKEDMKEQGFETSKSAWSEFYKKMREYAVAEDAAAMADPNFVGPPSAVSRYERAITPPPRRPQGVVGGNNQPPGGGGRRPGFRRPGGGGNNPPPQQP